MESTEKQRKMKILLVNKFLYPRGGAESYMLKLGNYFQNKGHSVAYFGMYDSKNIVGNPSGLYTSNMDFHTKNLKRLLYPFKIIYSMEAYRKFSLLLDQFEPDIIHLNNINFQLTPSIIDAADKRHIPVVQTVHDSQMVCPGHLLYDRNKSELCRLCVDGSKWNCFIKKCIHGSRLKSLIGVMEGYFYEWKKTYDKVDLYICPSSFMERVLTSKKRYDGKTRVILNFIEPVSRNVIMKKQNYILYFGRLSEEKGIHMFLKLARRFPEIQFKIAGSGPLENDCKHIENVEYLGILTGDALKKTVSAAKIVIFPSLCYENCPLSVLESISLGTPVIASSRGGTSDLIENGKTGILIKEPFDTDKMEAEIKRLLTNKDLLRNMSQECLSKSKSFLSVDQYGKEIEDIYINIINRKNESCNDRS